MKKFLKFLIKLLFVAMVIISTIIAVPMYIFYVAWQIINEHFQDYIDSVWRWTNEK